MMNWYKRAQQQIVYEIKDLADLSRNEKLALYRLNLGKGTSIMYNNFQFYLRKIKSKDNPLPKEVKVVIAKDFITDRIAGWALVNREEQQWDKFYTRLNATGKAEIHVYVSQRYRRLGIGTKLVNMAKEYLQSLGLTPIFLAHDTQSHGFYNSVPDVKKTEIEEYENWQKS